jgi:cytoplasmic iron level regulating protein YaaA (DUF328/UPF0246 family)
VFGRRLKEQRAEVLTALARTPLSETKLGATGPLYGRATAANQAVAAGRGRKLPAYQRYTGVVWEHLGPATLDDEQRAGVLVPSALLGLVTADDPVPDHRLKFDVSLEGLGRLDRHWRPHLTDAIKKRTTPHDTIVELLPQEHTAAIDLDTVARRRTVVRTTFRGTSGHDAKAVKGALARHLLRHGLAEPFQWQGWRATHDEAARTIDVSR